MLEKQEKRPLMRECLLDRGSCGKENQNNSSLCGVESRGPRWRYLYVNHSRYHRFYISNEIGARDLPITVQIISRNLPENNMDGVKMVRPTDSRGMIK